MYVVWRVHSKPARFDTSLTRRPRLGLMSVKLLPELTPLGLVWCQISKAGFDGQNFTRFVPSRSWPGNNRYPRACRSDIGTLGVACAISSRPSRQIWIVNCTALSCERYASYQWYRCFAFSNTDLANSPAKLFIYSRQPVRPFDYHSYIAKC